MYCFLVCEGRKKKSFSLLKFFLNFFVVAIVTSNSKRGGGAGKKGVCEKEHKLFLFLCDDFQWWNSLWFERAKTIFYDLPYYFIVLHFFWWSSFCLRKPLFSYWILSCLRIMMAIIIPAQALFDRVCLCTTEAQPL